MKTCVDTDKFFRSCTSMLGGTHRCYSLVGDSRVSFADVGDADGAVVDGTDGGFSSHPRSGTSSRS
jgi:hypothetical protein